MLEFLFYMFLIFTFGPMIVGFIVWMFFIAVGVLLSFVAAIMGVFNVR